MSAASRTTHSYPVRSGGDKRHGPRFEFRSLVRRFRAHVALRPVRPAPASLCPGRPPVGSPPPELSEPSNIRIERLKILSEHLLANALFPPWSMAFPRCFDRGCRPRDGGQQLHAAARVSRPARGGLPTDRRRRDAGCRGSPAGKTGRDGCVSICAIIALRVLAKREIGQEKCMPLRDSSGAIGADPILLK